MTTPTDHRPPTATLQRYVLGLAAVVLTVTAMYFGRDIILVMMFSGLLAFLLLPMVRGMERWLPRWVAALLGTVVIVLVVLGIFFFLGWQVSRFSKDLPMLQEKFSIRGIQFLDWVENNTNMDRRDQITWFNEHVSDLANWGGKAALTLFSGTGSVLASVLPIPIFVFLLLLLRDRFRTFLHLLGQGRDTAPLSVMVNISKLSRRYVRGMLTVMVIFGVLASTGFLLLGLKYAILLGFILAFLNLIPYIGALVGALLPMFVALVTKDSMLYALGALAVCLVVQFLDNNFITPKVVGSSVSINPLVSLVALLGFGSLWGVAGMLLAIPVTGMLKVICDSIPALNAWGYLLGEDVDTPEEERLKIPFTGRKGPGPASGKKPSA